MTVTLSSPSAADADEFLSAVAASRELHRPWIEPPDTVERFAAYLERSAREDQASFLVRQPESGALVGYVNVNNIGRGAFRSGYLGYAEFTAHAGRGLMTEGRGAVLEVAFGDLASTGWRRTFNRPTTVPSPSPSSGGGGSRRKACRPGT